MFRALPTVNCCKSFVYNYVWKLVCVCRAIWIVRINIELYTHAIVFGVWCVQLTQNTYTHRHTLKIMLAAVFQLSYNKKWMVNKQAAKRLKSGENNNGWDVKVECRNGMSEKLKSRSDGCTQQSAVQCTRRQSTMYANCFTPTSISIYLHLHTNSPTTAAATATASATATKTKMAVM